MNFLACFFSSTPTPVFLSFSWRFLFLHLHRPLIWIVAHNVAVNDAHTLAGGDEEVLNSPGNDETHFAYRLIPLHSTLKDPQMHQLLLIFIDLTPFLLWLLVQTIWGGIAALFIYMVIRGYNKAREAVAQWAYENGWQLVELSWRWRTGPFEEFRRRGDVFFKFVVLDNCGQRKTGWARYRASLYGKSEPDIKWVKETNQ